jgi:mRNA interferase MazF
MNWMRGGMMYNQRDIVLIPFPYSDLTGSKKRPALIISNSLLNRTEDRICCLVTSNFQKDDILIEKGSFEEGKLPFKSWIKPHRLFTINSRIVKKKLCKINADFHKKVVVGVNKYLN